MSLLYFAFSVAAVQAATSTGSNVNDSGTGSLRQAVQDANAAATGDIIEFDATVFNGVIGLTSGSAPTLFTVCGASGVEMTLPTTSGATALAALVVRSPTDNPSSISPDTTERRITSLRNSTSGNGLGKRGIGLLPFDSIGRLASSSYISPTLARPKFGSFHMKTAEWKNKRTK